LADLTPRLNLPPLDSAAREACRDPGLDPDPKIAAVETRAELAACAERHRLALGHLDEIECQFGLIACEGRDQ
jgi:hypothetical protein